MLGNLILKRQLNFGLGKKGTAQRKEEDITEQGYGSDTVDELQVCAPQEMSNKDSSTSGDELETNSDSSIFYSDSDSETEGLNCNLQSV